MSAPLALYCKSYRTDLRRLVRLTQSIQQFNRDELPFYVSVPASDTELFRQELRPYKVEVLCDDDILRQNPSFDVGEIQAMPGHVAQQIIKSEFWRLNLCRAYMCLDSDAFFIRPFSQNEYLLEDGTPYTVLDEGHELLDAALSQHKEQVVKDYFHDTGEVRSLFGRQGRAYSFGPFPVLWHRAVWESLEREYLQPHGMNFKDAIVRMPVESHWYGEALLKYRAIQIMPCQPLFKVYHYAWQLDRDLRAGVGNAQWANLYSGVIYQSSWEREMDWPSEGGTILSRVGRRIRRKLGRI